MRLDKGIGKVIDKKKAIDLTHAFQIRNPKSIKSYLIGSEEIKLILKQEGCIGIRIYDGLNNKNGAENRVLVGVNEKGDDMVSGVILDELVPCPKLCSESSPLLKKE